MRKGNFTHGMIERLLYINKSLENKNYPNTVKLAEALEVSIATISRDIEFLRDRLNAPIEYSYEKRGYYYNDSYFLFGEFEKMTFENKYV